MDAARFELTFRPNVQLVSVVRRFVAEFYQRFLVDADGAARVALATHELLENAVKYSRDGETRIRIEVWPQAAPRHVRLQLRNRAEPRHVAALREIVEAIDRAPDASSYYQTLITAKARERAPTSGLGLARIFAEADMRLGCTVDGDLVEIEASAELARSAS